MARLVGSKSEGVGKAVFIPFIIIGVVMILKELWKMDKEAVKDIEAYAKNKALEKGATLAKYSKVLEEQKWESSKVV